MLVKNIVGVGFVGHMSKIPVDHVTELLRGLVLWRGKSSKNGLILRSFAFMIFYLLRTRGLMNKFNRIYVTTYSNDNTYVRTSSILLMQSNPLESVDITAPPASTNSLLRVPFMEIMLNGSPC